MMASKLTAEALGSTIERLARERGMNQTQLADRIGTSRGTVSRIVNGRAPTLEQLVAIADVMELSVCAIICAAEGGSGAGAGTVDTLRLQGKLQQAEGHMVEGFRSLGEILREIGRSQSPPAE